MKRKRTQRKYEMRTITPDLSLDGKRSQQQRPAATGNIVREQLDLVRHAIRAVALGHKPLQLIGSEPGLGKSFTTLQELKALGIPVNYVAPANVFAFVKALYDHRNDKILVLDDCDALARSERVAGITKMAFGPTRTVVWDTIEARDNAAKEGHDDHDPNIPPPLFKVRCGLIWLSNIDFTEDDAVNVAKHMAPHFKALCSRGLDPIWIDTSDEEDLFQYCVWLGTEGNMLRSLRLSKSVSEAAIAWFIEDRNYLKEISPRQLRRAAEMIQAVGESARLLQTLLFNEEVRHLPAMRVPKINSGGKWA
jgi:hypothetical protein